MTSHTDITATITELLSAAEGDEQTFRAEMRTAFPTAAKLDAAISRALSADADDDDALVARLVAEVSLSSMSVERLALEIRQIESSPSAHRSWRIQEQVAEQLDELRRALAEREQ